MYELFYYAFVPSTCYKTKCIMQYIKNILENNNDHNSTTVQLFTNHRYLQPEINNVITHKTHKHGDRTKK